MLLSSDTKESINGLRHTLDDCTEDEICRKAGEKTRTEVVFVYYLCACVLNSHRLYLPWQNFKFLTIVGNNPKQSLLFNPSFSQIQQVPIK